MLDGNGSYGNNLYFHWSGQRRDEPSSRSQKSLETDVDVSSLNLVNISILRVQYKIFSLRQVLTKTQQILWDENACLGSFEAQVPCLVMAWCHVSLFVYWAPVLPSNLETFEKLESRCSREHTLSQGCKIKKFMKWSKNRIY